MSNFNGSGTEEDEDFGGNRNISDISSMPQVPNVTFTKKRRKLTEEDRLQRWYAYFYKLGLILYNLKKFH